MKLLFILSAFLLSSSVHATGERLIGTWKSDKEKSLAYLRQNTKFTADQIAKLAPILGKMTITYDGKRASWKMDKDGDERPYRIVADSPQMIIIESVDSKTQKKEEEKLRFSSTNEYWISDPRVPGFAECFVRQK